MIGIEDFLKTLGKEERELFLAINSAAPEKREQVLSSLSEQDLGIVEGLLNSRDSFFKGQEIEEGGSPFRSPLEEASIRNTIGNLDGRAELVEPFLKQKFGENNVTQRDGQFYLRSPKDGKLHPLNRSTTNTQQIDPRNSFASPFDAVGQLINDPSDLLGDAAQALPSLGRGVLSAVGSIGGGMAGAPLGPVGVVAGSGLGAAAAGARNEYNILDEGARVGGVDISDEEKLKRSLTQGGIEGAVDLATAGIGAGLMTKPVQGALKGAKNFVDRQMAKDLSLEAARVAEEGSQQAIENFAKVGDTENLGKFLQKNLTTEFKKAKSKLDDVFNKARNLAAPDLEAKKTFLTRSKSLDKKLGVTEGISFPSTDITKEFDEFAASVPKEYRSIINETKEAFSKSVGGSKNFTPQTLLDTEIQDGLEFLTNKSSQLKKLNTSGNLSPAGNDTYRGVQRLKDKLAGLQPKSKGAAGQFFTAGRRQFRDFSRKYTDDYRVLLEDGSDSLKPSQVADSVFTLAPESQKLVRAELAKTGKEATLDKLGPATALKKNLPGALEQREGLINNSLNEGLLPQARAASEMNKPLQSEGLKGLQKSGDLNLDDIQLLGGQDNIKMKQKLNLSSLRKKLLGTQDVGTPLFKEDVGGLKDLLINAEDADKVLRQRSKQAGITTSRTIDGVKDVMQGDRLGGVAKTGQGVMNSLRKPTSGLLQLLLDAGQDGIPSIINSATKFTRR